jgi:hypothetical protein
MTRTVAEKMGVRPGCRAHLVDAPTDVVRSMGLPDLDLTDEPDGVLDLAHLFVVTRAEMTVAFPRLRDRLAPRGALWVSWPKGHRLGSDLGLPAVIEIGYDHGLVESTCLRVDDTWAGLKFTRPRPGRTYRNSYGRLPAPLG